MNQVIDDTKKPTNEQQDRLLSNLVKIVNKSSLEMSIILFTPSGVMCGQMISAKRYFEETGALLDDGFKRSFPDFEADKDLSQVLSAAHDNPLFKDGYIHLLSYKLIDAKGNISNFDNCLWRGKLSEIAGFTLGNF
ncbi:hypothetical protein N480_03760 [Pseudoalteromonas luteoviolacea S2607]|uniref:hypothetical protein n=1 Tax=Pseudoalteromonas luteoviolacea TaxID=43657 RepID=UPI0007B09C04|nr:hypothetical protein [Pseudoalteromonas luteoviolacea]KZN30071.1 hypothetical protein N480_03760 [Pseudoalteromonas luteoviolacea S2607]